MKKKDKTNKKVSKESKGNKDAYDVEIIGDEVYRIHEFGASNCYLVLGSKRALLIDTGTGIGNLTKIIDGITNLPLDVVATHSHPDHIGGMGYFPQIYIHKDDSKHTGFWSSLAARKFYYDTVKKLIKYDINKSDIRKLEYKTKVIPIEDGHIFELGNKQIRVIHTPGHTKGSIILLDKEDRIMFAGDNVNPTLLHIVPGSTTIEEWLVGAKQTLGLADEYRVYNGHDDGIGTKKQIKELVELGEQLVSEYVPKKGIRGVSYYPNKKVRPRIIYYPWKVKNNNEV